MSAPAPEPQPTRPLLQRRGLLFSLLGMFLVLAFLVYDDLDTIGHMPWDEDPCALHDSDQSNVSARAYLRIARWDLVSRASTQTQPGDDVVILDINNQTAPSSVTTNSCESRAFLARLIHSLDNAGVSAIVIDQYFSPEFCSEDKATDAFKEAVQSSHTPIVLGWATHALSKASATGCLALNNPLAINNAPKLSYGLTRLASDDLRIPLSWPISEDSSQPITKLEPSCAFKRLIDPKDATCSKPAGSQPSLSLAAVLAAKPEFANSTRLTRAVQKLSYPYTTFDPKMPEENAMNVVCSADPHPRDIHDRSLEDVCKSWPPINKARPNFDLRGKIVIVGNVVTTDMKPFPTGDRPGVYLHANYIQSILDSRFLLEVPSIVTVPALILFLFVVYLLYWIADCHPWRLLSTTIQAGLWSVGLFAIIILASLVLLLTKSYYTPLWALWGAATIVVIRFFDAFGHHESQHLISHLFGQHRSGPVNDQHTPDPPTQLSQD